MDSASLIGQKTLELVVPIEDRVNFGHRFVPRLLDHREALPVRRYVIARVTGEVLPKVA